MFFLRERRIKWKEEIQMESRTRPRRRVAASHRPVATLKATLMRTADLALFWLVIFGVTPHLACSSVQSPAAVGAGSAGAPLQSSRLVIEKSEEEAQLPEPESLIGKWGGVFTSHMLEVDWEENEGWRPAKIKKYENLSISPAASVFHYGLEAFEGLKAYKDARGRARLFRPDLNLKRLNASLERLSFPLMDEQELMALIKAFVLHQKDWIPQEDGYSLYLRPTAISTHPSLGVAPAKCVKFFIIACPVGPYYPSGFKPVKLLADTKNVRAWPGGTGKFKLGSNYGATIKPAMEAQATSGCSQVLWLWGEQRAVREVGAMNIFFVLKKEDGDTIEIVSPALDAGDILPGVTRDSVLELCRNWGEFTVSEREITMDEITKAGEEGRLLECFATGTAAVISPVKCISYDGRDIDFPTGENIGAVAERIWKTLNDIQYGRVEHSWSIVVSDEDQEE